jgi:hypothetical protein
MKTTFIHNIRSLALVTALLGGLLISCEPTDYPDPQPSTSGFLTSARALIVNATNAAGLTALVENVTVSTGLAPGNNTAYTAVPVSSNQVRIQGAGGTLASTDLSAKSTFAANTSYTVFVTDTINRPRVVNATTGAVTDAGGVRLLTVTDPISQTLTAGAGGVRFFHLAPDAGLPTSSTATTPAAVSVRLSAPTNTSAVASFVNRAYRNITNNTFTAVPAGTYRVDVFTGTTIPTAATATPAVSSTITVETSKLYTLYARGLQRNRTLSVGRIQHN